MKSSSPLSILTMTVIALISGIIIVKGFEFTQTQKALREFPSKFAFAAGGKEAFDFLANTKSSTNSYCGLQSASIDNFLDEDFIQGSCCSAMDFHRYQEQVEELKKYSDISQIPEDPYNIPVHLAKELFDYQKSIALTTEQQADYEKAMEMSEEGGPCCCRCWRWTAFEGQAKYLITEKNFTAEQIAEVWNMEDGCGGSGHTHA